MTSYPGPPAVPVVETRLTPRSSDLRTMKINRRVLGMNHSQAAFFHQAQSSDDQNETLCCSIYVLYACVWREQM